MGRVRKPRARKGGRGDIVIQSRDAVWLQVMLVAGAGGSAGVVYQAFSYPVHRLKYIMHHSTVCTLSAYHAALILRHASSCWLGHAGR